MRKCILCHKGIPPEKKLIAFYDEKTQYIFHFCSWWHVIRWYIKRYLKKIVMKRRAKK